MTKALWLAPFLLFGVCGNAAAGIITFDTPEITTLFTHTYDAIQGPLLYSDSYPEFDLGELALTADGPTSGAFPSMFYFRNTFDIRTPYPYHAISGNVAQVYGTQLWLDFDAPISAFGFGAALNATVSPSTMGVELFLDGSVVSSGTLDLYRSPEGSNSEGLFAMNGIRADRVRLTNHGDGSNAASQYGWVIDNISFEAAPAPVPEPSTLLLASSGVVALLARRRAKCR